MSTILKALKRAEQDCPNLCQKNTSSLKFNVRKTLYSKVKRRQSKFFISSKRLVYGMGLVIVIASASYLLFFGNINFQSNHPPRKIASQPSIMASAELNERKAPARQPVDESNTSLAETQENIMDSKIMTVPFVEKKVLDLPENNTTSAFETKHLGDPEKTSQSQIIKNTTPPKTSQPLSELEIKKGDSNDIPASSEITQLKKGILKIQAIAWAEDPTERIAVINNKVLEEGGSVQGYRLIHIGKHEVLLRHSDRNFKLIFKSP